MISTYPRSSYIRDRSSPIFSATAYLLFFAVTLNCKFLGNDENTTKVVHFLADREFFFRLSWRGRFVMFVSNFQSLLCSDCFKRKAVHCTIKVSYSQSNEYDVMDLFVVHMSWRNQGCIPNKAVLWLWFGADLRPQKFQFLPSLIHVKKGGHYPRLVIQVFRMATRVLYCCRLELM